MVSYHQDLLESSITKSIKIPCVIILERKISSTKVLSWCEKNLAKYAILVLDMLNDFIKGSLKCERALKIIPNIRTLLDFARNAQIPIFYCVDEHLPTDRYELDLWGPHAMKGTIGQQIIEELKPLKNDSVITKRTYSAFDRTKLDSALTSAYDGKGVDTIIITGGTYTYLRKTYIIRCFYKGIENSNSRGWSASLFRRGTPVWP